MGREKVFGRNNSLAHSSSKQPIFGRNNSSPMRPKGLVKAGRNLVGSESEQILQTQNSLDSSKGQINFTSLAANKNLERKTNPGPGEYEIDMWRAVGANK